MLQLKNIGTKKYEMRVTKTPLSEPMKAPEPNLIRDPKDPRKKIPNPALYIEADTIALHPGKVVKFGENEPYTEEQGEYLYQVLGQPEDGGTDGGGKKVKNKNYIVEVNDKGEEVRDNLFRKYRIPATGGDIFTRTSSAEQFKAIVE